MNASLWVVLGFGLVASHAAMFCLGALTYHAIRWLAARPFYKVGGTMTDDKLQRMADQMLKKQMADSQLAHLQAQASRGVHEELIPEGGLGLYIPKPSAGKNGETAFAPSAKK